MANHLVTHGPQKPQKWLLEAIAGAVERAGWIHSGDLALKGITFPTTFPLKFPPIHEVSEDDHVAHFVMIGPGGSEFAPPRHDPAFTFTLDKIGDFVIGPGPDDYPHRMRLTVAESEAPDAAQFRLAVRLESWLRDVEANSQAWFDEAAARRAIEVLVRLVDEGLTNNEALLEHLEAAERQGAAVAAEAARLRLELDRAEHLIKFLQTELRRDRVDPKAASHSTRALRRVLGTALSLAVAFTGGYTSALAAGQRPTAGDKAIVHQLQELQAKMPAACDQVINITTNVEAPPSTRRPSIP